MSYINPPMSAATKQYVPPDATFLIFSIKKRIEENKDLKYIKVKVFKKYQLKTSMAFESGEEVGEHKYSLSKDNKPMWFIVEMFLPTDSEIKILKNGNSVDRVGIVKPKQAMVQISTPMLYPKELKDHFAKEVQSSLKHMFMFHRAEEKNDKDYFWFTEKNYELTEDEPKDGILVKL